LARVRSGRAAFLKVFGCPAGRLVQWGFFADHYDESLFPLEIVGDYFLAEEEQ
jgi:hypothetical protein